VVKGLILLRKIAMSGIAILFTLATIFAAKA
jgi:hypothetical protein